jgi:unsaturated rhamnogalacturonyl hydrolase
MNDNGISPDGGIFTDGGTAPDDNNAISIHRSCQKVIELADYITNTWKPRMKWMWGEGLLGHALSQLDEHRSSDRYTDFLLAYCDHYVANPPRVDQSDTTAPGLVTYAMHKKTGNPHYKALTDRVLHYIRHEPRLIEDSVNHLGNSWEGKLYPRSIWVDSLMMFSVFPALYAREQHDSGMLDIAARQPRVMAKYLMDPDDGLWYHSYWVGQRTHYPKSSIYWGRGNGWVIASLPMILENIADHAERDAIIAILRRTSDALLPYQRSDGCFETVLNKVGRTPRELSCTALVAAGWLHGYRLGVLPESFAKAGLRAFRAVTDSIQYRDDGIFMPETSGPTIPLPVFPYLGYILVPLGCNWSYGLAALILAAIEADRYLT